MGKETERKEKSNTMNMKADHEADENKDERDCDQLKSKTAIVKKQIPDTLENR